jgi:hypothetical protein
MEVFKDSVPPFLKKVFAWILTGIVTLIGIGLFILIAWDQFVPVVVWRNLIRFYHHLTSES